MKLFATKTKQVRKSRRKSIIKTSITVSIVAFVITSITIAATAKNTFIINDGDQKFVIKALTDSAEDVLAKAGVLLDDKDTYTVESSNGPAEITINRAQKVTVIAKGETFTSFSYGESVESVLSALPIEYDSDDAINYSLTDQIFDGMVITISDVEVTYSTVESVIPFETKTIENAELYSGTSKTIEKGQDGLRVITVKNVFIEGIEQDPEMVSDEIVTEMKPEVIEYGTKKKTSSADSSYAGTSTAGIASADGGVLTLEDGTTYSYTKALSFTATAYTTELQSNKITASGATAAVGIVAVDRSVIPLGTKLYIVGEDGSWVYGYAVAGDTGVSGRTVDLYYDHHSTCVNFGVKSATVYVLDE